MNDKLVEYFHVEFFHFWKFLSFASFSIFLVFNYVWVVKSSRGSLAFLWYRFEIWLVNAFYFRLRCTPRSADDVISLNTFHELDLVLQSDDLVNILFLFLLMLLFHCFDMVPHGCVFLHEAPQNQWKIIFCLFDFTQVYYLALPTFLTRRLLLYVFPFLRLVVFFWLRWLQFRGCFFELVEWELYFWHWLI